MNQNEKPPPPPGAWLPRVVLLAFLLVAAIWASGHFSAEARVRRATVRLIRLVEKPAAESPVALGLAANRLGTILATNAQLEVEGPGALAAGRQEIVQLFARIRATLTQAGLDNPEIAVTDKAPGRLTVRVAGRYRLVAETGETAEGDGLAELVWIRSREGWQILRVRVETGNNQPWLGNLK